MTPATDRHIAFLRAINVGGRRVKMAELREIFAGLGGGPPFADVETFQASGNVIFTVPGAATDAGEDAVGEAGEEALRRRIETGLADALGYEVETFLRTAAEVAAVAAHEAFPPQDAEAAGALNVAFLHAPPSPEAAAALDALESDADRFHLHGREVHWWCATKQSDSEVSNAVLERTLGQPSTMRTLRTVRTLAQRYGG